MLLWHGHVGVVLLQDEIAWLSLYVAALLGQHKAGGHGRHNMRAAHSAGIVRGRTQYEAEFAWPAQHAAGLNMRPGQYAAGLSTWPG